MKRLLFQRSSSIRSQQGKQKERSTSSGFVQTQRGVPCSPWNSSSTLAAGPLQFATNWKELPCPGTPRQYCAMVMWGEDKMIVVGGRDVERRILDSVEVYDFARWEWTSFPPLPQPQEESVAVVVDTKLYIMGGFSDGSYLTDCQVLDLTKPERGFTRLPNDLPQGLNSPIAVVRNEWIYVMGCAAGVDGCLDTVYALNTQTLEWDVSLPPLKDYRQLPTILIWEDQLVVAGGRTCDDEGNVQYLKSVSVLDLGGDKIWTTIPDLPLPRAGAVGFLFHDNLILAGGEENDNLPAHSFLWYDGKDWNFKPFPAMMDLCPGNIVVSLNRQRLIYVDVHQEMKFLSYETTPQAQSKSMDESCSKVNGKVDAGTPLVNLTTTKESLGNKSPRGIVDDMDGPTVNQTIAGPVLVGSDNPSPKVSPFRRKIKGFQKRAKNIEEQRNGEEEHMIKKIHALEIALESSPSLELVLEMMRYYREAIEHFEEAGDVRHHEITSRMQKFLSLAVVSHLLQQSSSQDKAVDPTSVSCVDSVVTEPVEAENIQDSNASRSSHDNADDVITKLLERFDSEELKETTINCLETEESSQVVESNEIHSDFTT